MNAWQIIGIWVAVAVPVAIVVGKLLDRMGAGYPEAGS